MKSKEKRAYEYANQHSENIKGTDKEIVFNSLYEKYLEIATEQEVIDEIDKAQIKELESIVELTASVMGIGTKWFSDDARMNAVKELREKILKYYE